MHAIPPSGGLLRWSTIEAVSADLKSRKVKLRGFRQRIKLKLMRSCPSANGTSVFQCSMTISFESNTKERSKSSSDVDVRYIAPKGIEVRDLSLRRPRKKLASVESDSRLALKSSIMILVH